MVSGSRRLERFADAVRGSIQKGRFRIDKLFIMKLSRKDYIRANVVTALGAGLALPALQSCNEKDLKKEETPSAWEYKPGEVKTGGVKMIDIDGGYKVWTKKLGVGKVKMLTLHGGPGCTHE